MSVLRTVIAGDRWWLAVLLPTKQKVGGPIPLFNQVFPGIEPAIIGKDASAVSRPQEKVQV